MLNLIKGEFYKLIKGRAFWLCLISLSVICAFTPLFLKFMIYDQKLDMVYDPIYDSLYVLAEEFIFNVMGVLTAIFIVGEYSTGSISQITGRGIHRVYFFVSKFIVVAVANIILMLSSVISRYIGAALIFQFKIQLSLEDLYKIGIILVGESIATLGLTVIYCLISYVFRNMAIAIPANCAAITVQKLFAIIIVVILNDLENARDWWFIEMTGNMARFNNFSTQIILKSSVIFIVTMVISLTISLIVFLKQDI